MAQQIIGPKSIVRESDRQNFEKHRDAINNAKDNILGDEETTDQSGPLTNEAVIAFFLAP